MKLDAAKWRRRPGLEPILEALGCNEGLTRYVGGAVRDELLNLPVSDVDLATKLQPTEVLERLKGANIKVAPTGLEHGTVTAISGDAAVEITTLRRDVATDGRRATVAFTDDWQEDAARRDFTINALSADPRSGEIFDYFGGLTDLKERRVRFIGDPLDRIAEDHLRILRFFRFHARFGQGAPDKEALLACTARANDLMALSRERIADELLKLLAVDDPTQTTAVMVSTGIFQPVLPEIGPDAVGRLEALIRAEIASGTPPDAIRRLSALLPPDPRRAEDMAVRLKLSTKLRKRLACAAVQDLDINPRALAYFVGMECAVDRLLLAGEAAAAAEVKDWNSPRLPIGGGDLIEQGLEPGPIVARTLQRIERRWVEAGFPQGVIFEAMVREALASALD